MHFTLQSNFENVIQMQIWKQSKSSMYTGTGQGARYRRGNNKNIFNFFGVILDYTLYIEYINH